MTVRTFARSVIGLAVAAAISGTAVAEGVVDNGVTFTIGGAYTDFDSYRGLDNKWAPELGIGYRYNDRFSVEGIYSEFKTDQKGGNDARLRNYRLDAFYDLQPFSGGVTPYIVAGIGELHENLQHASDREDTRMNMGVGLRKALTPNLSVRGDLRAIRSLDYNQTEGMMNVALTWTFGEPAAQPVEAVVEETIVEETVIAPLDSDNDGVLDADDLCPGTPAGATVDATGCVPQEEIDLLVEFDFDSANITDGAMTRIAEMGEFLQRHPDISIRVEGHTDDSGPAAYNKSLSQRRADAVRTVLIEQYNIDGSRVEAVGVGEEDPIADNSTLPGRKQNRRVVAEVL
ncbi:outer membrane porin OprF [Kistimonas scapharcae]|uniref:Outer membrane porin OprF n=1 Tax=Kistimonas scapharcae TaxID=1036133 RepID=A0ABP8V7M6_9GAMM